MGAAEENVRRDRMNEFELNLNVINPGYQMVCTSGPMSARGVEVWLANQIGYTMEDAVITNIDSFQIIEDGAFWRCIAVCRVLDGD